MSFQDSNLSLLVMFDDLMRLFSVIEDESDVQIKLLQYIRELLEESKTLKSEVARFEELYRTEHKENLELKDRLKNARNLLENEVLLRKRAEKEKECFKEQIDLVGQLLTSNKLRCDASDEDTVSKFSHLFQSSVPRKGLAVGQDAGASRLLLSCSADDLEVTPPKSSSQVLTEDSYNISRNGNPVPSAPPIEILESGSQKRKRSKGHNASDGKIVKTNDNERKTPGSVIATTIVTVDGDGGITASSQLSSKSLENKKDSFWSSGLEYSHQHANEEAMDEDVEEAMHEDLESPLNQNIVDHVYREKPPVSNFTHVPSGMLSISPVKLVAKRHVFFSKTILKPESCSTCNERIRFGRLAHKCLNCRVACHPDCKSALRVPCVQNATPGKVFSTGTITDHIPPSRPFIPAIVIRTIGEIEQRGLDEVGLYRVSGSTREIKEIREVFKRGKTVPDLRKYEVHSVCGAMKDFLKSLKDTVIPMCKWDLFVKACNIPAPYLRQSSLYEAVLSLNDPNKDTLAFIMLHLQRIAASPLCKMPASNLATVFAPTLGSCINSNEDLVNGHRVITCLIQELGSQYWEAILKPGDEVCLRSNQFSTILGPMGVVDSPPPPISRVQSSLASLLAKSPSKKSLFQSPMCN